MLQFTQHADKPLLRLLVLHDDAEREFAYTSGAEQALDQAATDGWTVVSISERLGHRLLSPGLPRSTEPGEARLPSRGRLAPLLVTGERCHARPVPDQPPPPRQLLLYRFDGDAKFEGRLVGAFERMESGGALRIVEALFIGRDAESGDLAVLDLRSRGAGSLVAPVIGFRLDPRERQRATERALGADGGEVLRAIGAVLAPGAAIAAVLVEHIWARALEDAVSQSGGTRRSSGLVEADSLSDLSALLVAAAGGD